MPLTGGTRHAECNSAIQQIANHIASKGLIGNQLDCNGLHHPASFWHRTHLDPFAPISRLAGYKPGYNGANRNLSRLVWSKKPGGFPEVESQQPSEARNVLRDRRAD